MMVLFGGVLGGCVPQSSDARLSNQLFERVEILGARGTALGQFNKPRSVAVDGQNDLYVVDMTGRVQKFSPEGKYLLSWYLPETVRGKPKGMAIDRAGNLVVLEPHYARVNHFSSDGTLVAQWGEKGIGPGQFSMPRAVAINSKGLIYVSEYTQHDRIQVFADKDKRFQFAFGQRGSGPGEFNRPEGLAIGLEDRLYVADSCNHRIQVFTEDGTWLGSYGRAGTGLGELRYPYDIRVDGQGRQYVCEFGNSRIQVFDSKHEPIEVIGALGYAPGQFSNPWSIALDSKGHLYVADSGNHRIQKLIRP
jgi:DNA-binding beta-propeller fold protein YncE